MREHRSRAAGALMVVVCLLSGIGCAADTTEVGSAELACEPVGLTGEYFDNRDLTNLKITRIDPRIAFDWGTASPDPSIGADTFSVRWTGQMLPPTTETYTFYTRSDDGVRLWVDGRLLVDNWTDHSPSTNRGTIALVAGRKVDVRMEMYENTGGAVARLQWSTATIARQVVPTSQLFPAPCTTPPPPPPPPTPGATLSGSHAAGAWGARSLSTEGTLDWAHWGLGGATAFNRKSGASAISNFTRLGTGALVSAACCLDPLSWSGGTPTASVSGTDAFVYVDSASVSGAGFRFTVPADTAQKTLKVYAGAWAARLRLAATLSDGSAPAYVSTAFDVAAGAANTVVYTVSYAAASSGQSLTVDLTIDSNHATTGDLGEVWLAAATLSGMSSGGGGDTTPPSTPSGFAALSSTQTSIATQWTASTDNVGVVGYRLYRNGAEVGTTASTSFTFSGLTCATSYTLGVAAYDAAGNASSQASVTASTLSCSTPPPGAPTLQEVDGGPGYYASFASPLPTAASYFPIGAWVRPAHDSEHFGDYANFGMNVFVGVECPECAQESMIRAAGMKAIIQANERTRFDDLGSETVGWLLYDEVDMIHGPGAGYTVLDGVLAGLPSDGRLRYNNYGKGVLEWESDGEASQFINGRSGPNSFQQVVSTDYYWFTDPNALGNPGYGFGSSYGTDVARVRYLDAMDGRRMPVWHFVELGWPFTEGASAGGRRILPAEIRSAVWHAIIAGARGIIYFDHNFGPGTPGSTILEEGYEDNRVAATQVNTQIRSLAAVLNGPFVTSGHSATDTMTGTVRYMVKWASGRFWVFAGADRGAGSATFSIPCIGGATAVVEGESRSIAVSAGSFTDSFADKNAIHIYRIDGGSSCGLM